MAKKTLEEAIMEASEIASKLPENLQERAFDRALDEILGGPRQAGEENKPRKTSRTSSSKSTTKPPADQDSKPLSQLIDRTRHPDVGATARIADQALKVLEIAKDDYGIDGLIASEIANILTEKFRLPASRRGVAKALSSETRTVNERREGNRVYFHLMAPGEDYLRELRTTDGNPTAKPARRRKSASKKAASKTPKKAAKKKAGKSSSKKAAAKSKSGRLGPTVAARELLSDGYFSSGRKIAEIQSELQHNRGHTFSIQELSPILLRLVRDRSLKRVRDDSGQYEYSEA